MSDINNRYTNFYAKRKHTHVYPTEFVVRTFLSDYPLLNYERPSNGKNPSKILDIGFGDGRNTAFLCEQGYDVYGIEITEAIVEQTKARLIANKIDPLPDLRVGRNSNIPYEDNYFNYILACHSCYYVDDNQSLNDNLKEYYRVLSPSGYLIASIIHSDNYYMKGASHCDDGSMIIINDPYETRNGYRLHGFANEKSIEKYFSSYFHNYSFGSAYNNYYGIDEKVFWVVCQSL